MNLRRKLAVSISALALTIGGGVLTAPPAAADEPCASNKLCLYRSTLYRTMEFETINTHNCWWLGDYNLDMHWSGIQSYRNNLSVKATLWNYNGVQEWDTTAYATISPGGKSSDSGTFRFTNSEAVCTGTAKPWDYFG
ncbi:peptidase inhibitor [Streptomyces virginiae]|uniref:peptidase inhibitor n=1 Tax=Streptomyces virginiae TaxID=1961 RepID=UPI0036F80F0E